MEPFVLLWILDNSSTPKPESKLFANSSSSSGFHGFPAFSGKSDLRFSEMIDASRLCFAINKARMTFG
ncbi:hypothetical protein ACK369_19930 [Aeromonas veronii]